jgi:hypothetical protein
LLLEVVISYLDFLAIIGGPRYPRYMTLTMANGGVGSGDTDHRTWRRKGQRGAQDRGALWGVGEGEDMLCGLPVAIVCSSPIHQGGEKVKIIGVRWVLGEAVLLTSKAVAARTPFVA